MSRGRIIIVLLAVAAAVPACNSLEMRGAEWRAACETHAGVGCACRHSKDCATQWCVSGECAQREP